MTPEVLSEKKNSVKAEALAVRLKYALSLQETSVTISVLSIDSDLQ